MRRSCEVADLKHHRGVSHGPHPDCGGIGLLQTLVAEAQHLADHPSLVDLPRIGSRDTLAVAKHRHPVRDREHVLDEVRDEDEAASLLALEAIEDLEEGRDLGRRERRGRLVEDDDRGARKEYPRELDELLQTDGEVSDPLARVDVEAEARQESGRTLAHRPPVDDAEAPRRLRAEEDVLGDREVGRDRELLVHHADTGVLGVAGRAKLHGAAGEREPALVGKVDAREDLHEGRLAGAVLADEGVHLAGSQREVDARQCTHAAETLRDTAELKQRRPGRGRRFGKGDAHRPPLLVRAHIGGR